jgi:hypothetical protein
MRWEGTDVVVQWEAEEKKTHVVCSVSFRPVNPLGTLVFFGNGETAGGIASRPAA